MLTCLTLEQSAQWDEIVRSFSAYDVFWLSGYVKAFQLHGDGEPRLFYYNNPHLQVRGINVVMWRDISQFPAFKSIVPPNTWFDITTPYGYGGWLIEGTKTTCLFEAYDQWCVQHHVVSEFVRFHPLIKNYIPCVPFYQTVELGEVVAMALSSPKQILENMSGKNRNMIRKALKNDVQVYNGRFPQIYNEFRSIYNATMDKDHADSYYYFKPEFYDSMLKDLPYNVQVFYAVKDSQIIAASIILAANKKLTYHLSGSVAEYRSLAATNLLLYQVALWGYANGFESLYLGGGVGSAEDNLFKFKRAFYKGDLNHFYVGKKIYNQIQYDELIQLRSRKEKDWQISSFFPQYRGK